MILTVRTDKPEAELGLYSDQKLIDYSVWTAHRELGSTIHSKIEDLLTQQGVGFNDITGIVFYEGPGSFTGLRIGASVANALQYSLGIPLANASGEQWQSEGINKLLNGGAESATPAYGQDAFTTAPKK